MDGEWIYYVHGIQATAADIWRIRSTGREPERLTHLNTEVKYLAPIDGRTILFVAPDENRAGPWLWALDVEQKTIRRVSIGLERYLSVSASANGRRLAATVARSSASLWSAPILEGLVAESDVKRYGPPMPRALAPRFAGASLLFLSSNGPGDGLWRLRDGAPEEIWKGANGVLLESAGVSRDGQRIAILLRRGGRLQLNLLSPDGAAHTSIAESIDAHGTSSWSPDSKWIVTGGTDANGAGLFKIPVDGGMPVRLADGPTFDPVWSPTDDRIVYIAGQNALAPLRAVTSGGTPVPFPEVSTGPRGGGRVRFLPGGQAIVYVQGAPGMQDFWMMDLATQRSRRITQLANRATIGTFDITPDGRHIVFDRIREDSDVRIIDLRR
jgi:Tol biopolymer transport system component